MATVQDEQEAENDEDHDADDGDGRILPLEIGLRAFGNRGGDLLHPRRAGVRLQKLMSPSKFHMRRPKPPRR